jgi:hypothetical protein
MLSPMERPEITVRSASYPRDEGGEFRVYQAAYVDPSDPTKNRTAKGGTYYAALRALRQILEQEGYRPDELPKPH